MTVSSMRRLKPKDGSPRNLTHFSRNDRKLDEEIETAMSFAVGEQFYDVGMTVSSMRRLKLAKLEDTWAFQGQSE